MFGTFDDSHPPTARHRLSHTARIAVIATTVAMGGVAMAVTATPSSAAACNGYVGLTFDDGPDRQHQRPAQRAAQQRRAGHDVQRRPERPEQPVGGAGPGRGRHVGRQPQLEPPPHDLAEPGPDAVRAVPDQSAIQSATGAPRGCSARRTGRPTAPSSRSPRRSACAR